MGLSEELPKPQKVREHQVQLLPSINCIFIIVTKRTNQISQQDSQQVATNSTNNKGDKHPDQPKSVFDLIKRRPYHFIFYFYFLFFSKGIKNMLTDNPETKRKRHDLTPISKSQASSYLIQKLKRNKGTFIYKGIPPTPLTCKQCPIQRTEKEDLRGLLQTTRRR